MKHFAILVFSFVCFKRISSHADTIPSLTIASTSNGSIDSHVTSDDAIFGTTDAEINVKKVRRQRDWRADYVPKRPKILKNDPRRRYAFDFINAMNSSDVEVLWDFCCKYTTPNVEYRERITTAPPPPLQWMQRERTLFGQHRLCHAQYARSQIFIDGMMHLKGAKLHLRSDGTAMLKISSVANGSAVAGPDVLNQLDKAAENFNIRIAESEDNTRVNKNKSKGNKSSNSEGSSTDGSYRGSSNHSGEESGVAVVSSDAVPDLIYSRVHRILESATATAAAVSAAGIATTPIAIASLPALDVTELSELHSLSAVSAPAVSQRLSAKEVRSMLRAATATTTMLIDRQMKIHFIEMVYLPTDP